MITFESMLHTDLNKEFKHNKTYSQIVVIKIGGSILSELPDTFYKEIVYLLDNGWFPVIVHGGGPSISGVLAKMGMKSTFVDGLRVTDLETLDVVQMVLNGKENSEVVKRLFRAGGKAIGLSGIDDGMILAEQLDPKLGYVGTVKNISFSLLNYFLSTKTIPVISPLGMGEDGQIYNINADTVAQAVAINLGAKKILMVSDIPGIYHTDKGEKVILHSLTPEDIECLRTKRQVTDGMIPKVDAAIHCLEEGVEDIYILDGREEGVLSKIYNDQLVGTKIYRAEVI